MNFLCLWVNNYDADKGFLSYLLFMSMSICLCSAMPGLLTVWHMALRSDDGWGKLMFKKLFGLPANHFYKSERIYASLHRTAPRHWTTNLLSSNWKIGNPLFSHTESKHIRRTICMKNLYINGFCTKYHTVVYRISAAVAHIWIPLDYTEINIEISNWVTHTIACIPDLCTVMCIVYCLLFTKHTMYSYCNITPHIVSAHKCLYVRNDSAFDFRLNLAPFSFIYKSIPFHKVIIFKKL